MSSGEITMPDDSKKWLCEPTLGLKFIDGFLYQAFIMSNRHERKIEWYKVEGQ